MTQTDTDFHKQIRYALNHLYHPQQLRKSILVEWFGLSGRPDTYSALQITLSEAIQSLRPVQYEPMQSEARKIFEILSMRYIQQFDQQEVAHHMGVSERQFRREQDRAIDILADFLRKKYPPPAAQPKTQSSAPDQAEPPAAKDSWDNAGEWGWLKNTHSESITNTSQSIRGIVSLIQPVASQYQVDLAFNIPDLLPDLAIHPVALRQILLNTLRVAIAHGSGSQVSLQVVSWETTLELHVTAHALADRDGKAGFDQEGNLLEIAERLAGLCHSRLIIDDQQDHFKASLQLPVVEGLPVLVIDDNRDIIELLQRYTTGTRYHVIGLDDPELMFATIASSGARLIILDVMMPKIDGWELLGRLRQHPLTSHLPVIIFSILAQEELALSLGARSLLVKPVTQEKFLAEMDRVFLTLNSASQPLP
jgi:CheY-like chemotaxis protein